MKRVHVLALAVCAAALVGCQHAPANRADAAVGFDPAPAAAAMPPQIVAGQAPQQAAQAQQRAQVPQQAQGVQQPVQAQHARVEFRLAQLQPAAGLHEVKLRDGSLWMASQPVLTRADLTGVQPRRTSSGHPYVRFVFSQEGAQKLAAISRQFPGKLLALTLDDTLVAAPQIQGPISTGVLDVGFGSDEQAVGVAREVAR